MYKPACKDRCAEAEAGKPFYGAERDQYVELKAVTEIAFAKLLLY